MVHSKNRYSAGPMYRNIAYAFIFIYHPAKFLDNFNENCISLKKCRWMKINESLSLFFCIFLDSMLCLILYKYLKLLF